MEKTAGYREVLKRALSDPEIRLAFIFGSVASGKAKPGSDLDLRKIEGKDHFISSLMESQKIFLIGDENEFKRMGKKRLATDQFVVSKME